MDGSVVLDRLPQLALGLAQSLQLCAVAATGALALGAGLTWVQLRGSALLVRIAGVYTAICLGLPLLIVIYLLFYALPEYGVTLEPAVVGVLALVLYYAPYFAQVITAAIKSIPPGHAEAAASIGLSRWRAARRILLPQALPILLPPATGLLIGLIKDSALLSVVSVPEFMFAARQAISETYAPLEIYAAVALVYWVLNTACAALAGHIEHRLSAHARPVRTAAAA